jgi:HTH-type transcriptional regulator/antitoxin HipB
MAVSKFMDALKLGAIIRFHRKKGGLSQTELALLAGLGKTVIYDLEKGKLSVRLDTLLKVLKVLNITITLQSPLMSAYEDFNEKS